jgi:hypothetical protein
MNDPLKNLCFNKMAYAEEPEIPTDDDGTNKMITFDYTGYIGRWNNKADTDYSVSYTTGLVQLSTSSDTGTPGDGI